jgi:hypothetical protein
VLSDKKPYKNLPAERNPNVVAADGKILPEVSPFGPVELWREAGRGWTDRVTMKRLEQWYPDPPLVIFLSNNEHAKLRWCEVEKSKRYLSRYGNDKSAEFKRKVVADGWIERYRALQEGMRDGLVSKSWKNHAIFCVAIGRAAQGGHPGDTGIFAGVGTGPITDSSLVGLRPLAVAGPERSADHDSRLPPGDGRRFGARLLLAGRRERFWGESGARKGLGTHTFHRLRLAA